jgi:hypothetical protein
MCYQSSIEGQFEYVSSSWLSSTRAERPIDALIGRRTGELPLRNVAIASVPIALPDFTRATGAGYFLTPSRSGLQRLLG